MTRGERDGGWHVHLHWDAEAHLTKVVQSGTTISTNTYNALGQRVRDVTSSATTDEAYGAGGNCSGATRAAHPPTAVFVPFNGGILAEYYSGGTLFDHPDELGSNTASTTTAAALARRSCSTPTENSGRAPEAAACTRTSPSCPTTTRKPTSTTP